MFHERRYATAIGCLQMFLSAGTQIGPLIAGYLIQARGWQWFFNLTSILIAVNIVFVLFLLPETTYRRNVVDGQSAAEPIDEERSNKSENVENVEYLSAVDQNAPYSGSYVSLYLIMTTLCHDMQADTHLVERPIPIPQPRPRSIWDSTDSSSSNRTPSVSCRASDRLCRCFIWVIHWRVGSLVELLLCRR